MSSTPGILLKLALMLTLILLVKVSIFTFLFVMGVIGTVLLTTFVSYVIIQ